MLGLIIAFLIIVSTDYIETLCWEMYHEDRGSFWETYGEDCEGTIRTYVIIAFVVALIFSLLLCYCEIQILYYGWKEQEKYQKDKKEKKEKKSQIQSGTEMQNQPPIGQMAPAGGYYMQPGMQPGMMQPGMQPGMMQPGMQPMQPGMQPMQPGMMQPMQPGMMQPGMMQPGMQPMQPGMH